tara:strand:+ start:712 stop:939 length:228 start_codon:yes stop_codon:yes gene_type:complete
MQFISDNEGKTTGVFIPITEWNNLKKRFKELNQEDSKVPDWHISEVNERMAEYSKNPKKHSLDFDEAMDEIEREL